VGYAAVDTIDSGGDTVATAAPIAQAGGIGYLYPMQGGPAYGIGRDVDSGTGLPGTLYRETEDFCNPATIRSVWTSQTVVSGQSCATLEEGASVAAAKCQPGADGGNGLGETCNSPADSRCVVTGACVGGSEPGTGCSVAAECAGVGATCDTVGAKQCSCPDTFDGGDANDWIAFGSNCCPPGSTEAAPGQCTIGNTGILRIAVPVESGAGVNALSTYIPPFRINFPVAFDATFENTDPDGVEGPP